MKYFVQLLGMLCFILCLLTHSLAQENNSQGSNEPTSDQTLDLMEEENPQMGTTSPQTSNEDPDSSTEQNTSGQDEDQPDFMMEEDMLGDDGMGEDLMGSTSFEDIGQEIQEDVMEESQTGVINGSADVLGAQINYSLGGYLKNELYMFIKDSGGDEGADRLSWGNLLRLRLRGEWVINDGLLVHFELLYTGNYGLWNPIAMYDQMDVYDAMLSGQLGPMASFFSINDLVMLNAELGYDYKHRFEVDQAYAEFDLWRFTFQVGRMVVGWGMGYFINPTDKVNNPNIMDPVEQLPGTTVININLALWQDTSIVTYFAFEDRAHKNFVLKEDAEWENIPLGIKFRTNIEGYYFAVGFIREVFYDAISQQLTDRNFAMLEWFMDVWVFGFYGEATCYIPHQSEDLSDKGFDYFFTGMAGLDYIFPPEGPQIRLEYYRNGWGQDHYYEYEITRQLTGDLILLAKDYLLLHINKGFWGKFFIDLIGVYNINDTSFGLFPMIRYNIYEDCEITMGAYTFIWTNKGDEFSGQFALDEDTTIDFYQQMIYLRLKVSF